MKYTNIINAITGTCLLFLSFASFGQNHDHPDVVIHNLENGEPWTNCSFVIHHSLTQDQFRRFTREAGSIIYFQPLSAASSLGKLKFDIGLSMTSTPIDQTAGAWNNTFAHPIVEEGPHWLGDKVSIPNLRFRMGITDNIELGTYVTRDFSANYGFYGVDLKYSHLVSESKGIYMAGRISHARLFGPESLKFNASALDILASKKWLIFEPYIGLSGGVNFGRETSSAVHLDNELVITPRVLAGTRINYKWASASVEYDISSVNTLSFKIGATF